MSRKNNVSEFVFTDEDINLFIRKFSTGHWATQGDLNEARQTTHYLPASEKGHLTPGLVRKHLETEITLASYTITRDNTCRFLVIDFDIEGHLVKNVLDDPAHPTAKAKVDAAMEEIKLEVKDVIFKLEETLRINRNQILIERSGSKGYHIWLFFTEDVESRDAYMLGRVIARSLDLMGYEIYPMQEFSEEGRPGSLIKLPLGVNRKTFVRCLFLDDNFEPDPRGQWQALLETEGITPDQLSNILKLQDTESSRMEDEDIKDLTSIGGNINKMIEECSALQAIADKSLHANADEGYVNLTHDERLCILSLFKRFGIVGESKIHEFLSNCDNYDLDKTNKVIADCEILPMRCETMIERGICSGLCDNITRAGGKSPIKLAGMGKGASDIYILNSLAEIENPVLCNKNVRVDFTVNSLVGSPYFSAKKYVFAPCNGKTCKEFGSCSRADAASDKEVVIPSLSKMHLQLYGVDDARALRLVKGQVSGCAKPDALSLKVIKERTLLQPFTCSNVVKSIDEHVEESQASPIYDGTTAAKEMKDYFTFYLGNTLESSKNYRGYGKILPNPNDQSITLLFDKVENTNNYIDDFTLNAANSLQFEAFKALSLKDKIQDLQDNITMIYGRQEVILALLLTHFSVLEFNFNGAPISKGWMETLLVGDTGQAKSQLTLRLMNYIGLGRACSANSSAAGLIGGIVKVQNKNYINWGTLPRSNKSLVFMDEVQNLNFEVTSQLRTVRANGYADVNKIEKGKHEAKVRLICAANPMPKEKTLAEFKYGAQALTSVMSAPDIRRFDIACILNEADNDISFVNRLNLAPNPIMSREMLQTAVLWQWSRKPEHIVLSEEVTRAILDGAKRISSRFDVGAVPICNTSDMREKIARMTVAMAGIQGKTPDNVRLVPDLDDVEQVLVFLEGLYSHKSFGLDKLHAEKKSESNIDEFQFNQIRSLLSKPDHTNIRKVITGLVDMGEIRSQDLFSWAQLSDNEKVNATALIYKFHLVDVGRNGTWRAKQKLIKLHNMLNLNESGGDQDDMSALF